MTRLIAALALLLSAVLVAGEALAQTSEPADDVAPPADNPTSPPGTAGVSDHAIGQTIVSQGGTETQSNDSGYAADVAAARPHDAVTESAGAVCAEEVPDGVFIDPVSGEVVDLYVCAGYWACGAERVDDIYTGRISGAESGGKYAQYIGQIVALIPGDVGPIPGVTIDADSLATYLVTVGLDDAAHDAALPVFYWCQASHRPGVELFEVPYAARLGWDTSFLAEYPIDEVRQRVLDELLVALNLYNPELRAIPPLDGGFTYVQFPMWFWVHELKEYEFRWAVSDLENIFIGMRAKLHHVEWDLGDATIECTVEDMVAYDPDNHDVVDDLPDCSYIFTQLDDVTLEATLVYEVEERIAYRHTTLEDFTDAPWVPHPTQADVELTSSTGPIEVHQLLALNVASD